MIVDGLAMFWRVAFPYLLATLYMYLYISNNKLDTNYMGRALQLGMSSCVCVDVSCFVLVCGCFRFLLDRAICLCLGLVCLTAHLVQLVMHVS